MLWLISVIVGIYVLAAAVEYLIALRVASGVRFVRVRGRSAGGELR